MSFPAYDTYKDSGVDWLGFVPSNWDIVALKYIVNLKSGDGITGESIEETGEYPVYGGNGIRGYTDNFTHDGHYVVVGRQGALCGNINYVNGRFWASEHAVVASPLKPVDTIWLGEMLRAMNLNQYSISAAQPGLSMDFVGNLRTVLPSEDEQRTISSFLDAETSKIDRLVSEQRRLIELLKEKRQAVISHAVIKGLNPHAPMKPSGIQWLGEVPQHWEVRRVKHSITSIEQGWSPQCENDPVQNDHQWGVLKVGCVNYGRFTAEENKALPPTLEPQPELGIKKDDLLISRANTIELVGSAAVAERDYSNLMLCDKLYRLRMDHSRVLPEFLCFFLSSEVAREPIELGATGASSSMKNIAHSVIVELWFAAPDVTEQREIIDAIRERRSDLTRLIAEAERAIGLLQERRTAVISAAVTGKIDVREVAHQETL